MQFGQLKTASGYLNSECTSAMQKCIRRGLEEDALFWATELDLAGYGAYVWKRLQIIASEDIGLADPNVCVQVRALYDDSIKGVQLRRGLLLKYRPEGDNMRSEKPCGSSIAVMLPFGPIGVKSRRSMTSGQNV